MCVSVSVCVCEYVCVLAYVCVSVIVRVCVFLFRLSVYLAVCLFDFLSVYLSVLSMSALRVYRGKLHHRHQRRGTVQGRDAVHILRPPG